MSALAAAWERVHAEAARLRPIHLRQLFADDPDVALVCDPKVDGVAVNGLAGGSSYSDQPVCRSSDARPSIQRFLNVYGRAGDPCQACKDPIERIVQQQRSTFFCPTCHKVLGFSTGRMI